MFAGLIAYWLVTAKAFAELKGITDFIEEDEFFATRLFEIVATEYSQELRDLIQDFRSGKSRTSFAEFAKQVNQEINRTTD